MSDNGFLAPPEAFYEATRIESVDRYLKLRHWGDRQVFKRIISKIRREFKVNGVSISLIDKTKTFFKYETLLGTAEIPRAASIDGHAMLSQNYFLLSDASKDWRTRANPFVVGSPNIKFYCGVPLLHDKDVIGVLAVFDAHPKTVLEESCGILREAAQEIMEIVKSPYSMVTKTKSQLPANAELAELSIKLGRATSRGTLMTVFEKDGSGSPYAPNSSFRFSKFLKDATSTQEAEFERERVAVKASLAKAGNLKQAATILAQALCQNLKVDFVYILEIRIAEPFTLPSECFPKNTSKVDTEGFPHTKSLVRSRSDEKDFMSRIIGLHGVDTAQLNFENLLHFKAFASEFGISYKDPSHSSSYNKGIVMPFYRYNSKLVRKRRERETDGHVDVYLRSGGFLVGMFNVEAGQTLFDSDMVSHVFRHTSLLCKLYIT